MELIVFLFLAVCQLLVAGCLLLWAAKNRSNRWTMIIMGIAVALVILAPILPGVIVILLFR